MIKLMVNFNYFIAKIVVKSVSIAKPEAMTSMTSLAEDLLKTRTIPELRDRVNQLDKESNAKKTELQLMVGSKYHDFIQSADMINEMRGQVTTVEQQIELLWK